MSSANGITWSVQSASADNSWNSVCWSPELSLFVAVASSGSGNRVMTSIDGVNWISRTSASNNSWNSVCWSSDLLLFVAVASSGTGNRIMISYDGISWSTQTSVVDNSWSSICWSNNLSIFVTVSNTGTGNCVMVSNLGIAALKSSVIVTGPNQIYSTGSNIKIGGSTGSGKLSIGADSNYNCLRLKNNFSNTNYTDIDLESSGIQIKCSVNGSSPLCNIPNHNLSTTGLSFNNVLLLTSASDLNKLDATPGSAFASKALVMDSSLNISGINSISCNILNINNNIILSSSDNNSSYVSSITPGTASASKVLVVDSSKNITGINSLSLNSSMTINNTSITNGTSITNHHLKNMEDTQVI
jgi:hypothetical protein